MRKWDLLTTVLDPQLHAPLFVQLANAIAGDIRDGRLRPGDALPGTRALAQQLGIHRNTALAGYRELLAQGLVSTRSGGGTFVAEPPKHLIITRVHSDGGVTTRGAAIDRAVAAHDAILEPSYSLPPLIAPPPMLPPDPPGTYMLFRGVPDTRLLPAEVFARAYRRALARHGRTLLGYTDPRGHAQLRDELATMLAHTRGVICDRDSVMVTRGSQQALFLVAQALLSPGDIVAVEELGNPAAWSALRHTGAELVPVPLGGDGLDIAALAALARTRRLRAVYVTPHHQFPTNAVMPAHRRAELAALALAHDFAVVEDDYDHEFHYEGRPLAPIAAGPAKRNAIYVGSLSKVLAPGLRIGFVVAPPAVIERLASLRAVCDMQGDAVVECAVAELFEDGELLRHVYRMRETYGRRRTALAAALAEHLPTALTFAIPDGGMAIWARVAPAIDLATWCAAGEQRGVLFRGAGMFDFSGRAQPFLRIGFTYHDESELAAAVRVMAAALPTPKNSSTPLNNWRTRQRCRHY
jgi:GntR family transcriptional regulator/MocR family aminotransferase